MNAHRNRDDGSDFPINDDRCLITEARVLRRSDVIAQAAQART